MKWHKTEIINLLKEKKNEWLFSCIFLTTLLAWHFLSGQPFQWQNLEVVQTPPWQRLLYSALVFVSLGWFLYWIKFYQLLHTVFIKKFGAFKAYKEIKVIIWGLLLLAMYFYIVPFVVATINQALSIIYNCVAFVLYLLPPAGLALIAYSTIIFVIKKATKV